MSTAGVSRLNRNGPSWAVGAGSSDTTAHQIEEEAQRILSDAVDSAKRLLSAKRPSLDRPVRGLLQQETRENPTLMSRSGRLA